jgi:hypothetical protein
VTPTHEKTNDESPSIWKTSFSVGDTENVPLGVRVFGIGCHLAEILADLLSGARRPPNSNDATRPGKRQAAESDVIPPDSQHFIDDLDRDFGNLRELLYRSEPSLAAALIDPAIDRFAETLTTIGRERPKLAEKCESLAHSLSNLLASPTDEPELYSDDDSDLFGDDADDPDVNSTELDVPF